MFCKEIDMKGHTDKNDQNLKKILRQNELSEEEMMTAELDLSDSVELETTKSDSSMGSEQ